MSWVQHVQSIKDPNKAQYEVQTTPVGSVFLGTKPNTMGSQKGRLIPRWPPSLYLVWALVSQSHPSWVMIGHLGKHVTPSILCIDPHEDGHLSTCNGWSLVLVALTRLLNRCNACVGGLHCTCRDKPTSVGTRALVTSLLYFPLENLRT